MNYIYTLSCPISGDVRYVGKTNNLPRRYSAHICDKSKSHKTSWIKSLSNKDLKPILDIIDESEDEIESYKQEVYWISQFKTWGFNLCNLTDGGEGFSNVANISGENNWNNKITEETAKAIVADLVEDLLSFPEMQAKYNVGLGTVSNIKYGKSWQKLTKNLKFERYKRKPNGNANRAAALKAKGVYKKLSKSINQYDLTGEFIQAFESISEACRKTNTNRTSISSCLSGNINHANNFIWKTN